MLNEQNYDYLKRQLFFTGFGEELNAQLREKIEHGSEKFTLEHRRMFGKDETVSALHFSKGTKSDNYFFNTYDLVLRQPGKDEVKQIVFIGDKYNYTLKERYNMLDGRAVFKEQPALAKNEQTGRMEPTGETYVAWKDLDLKSTDKLGNFAPKTMHWEHKKELQHYPIKELATPYDKSRLLTSLEKGDKAKVTILGDGEEIKGFIAANPRQQRLDFFDSNGQRITVRKVEKVKHAKTEDLEKGKGQVVNDEVKKQQEKAATQKPDDPNNTTPRRTRQRMHVS